VKTQTSQRRLVLVGGGHVHVQVLRSLVMRPRPDVHVTVVVDRPVAVYSGMIPGHVAGRYSAWDVSIDVLPLARRAGAAVVLAAATRLDAERREVQVAGGRPPVAYDICSINIGSTVSDLTVPGVREHAVPTRPIYALDGRIEARVQAMGDRGVAVVVVGAGAAGVELAFAMHARLKDRPHTVTLVSETDPRVGGGSGGPKRVKAGLARRGIGLKVGARVASVESDGVVLTSGERVDGDVVLWATGPAAHAFGRDSGLPVDDRGFIRTLPTLEVVDHPGVFAAGDCAVLDQGPVVPRAGVYAVRSGPVLTHNLLVAESPEMRVPFRPQSTFLALLNTCDGRAIGTLGGWAGEGRWLGALKHWIDVGFMKKFQVLDADGVPAPEFDAGMPPMADEMVCGGCAAKLADAPLRRALRALPPPPADPDVVAGVDAKDDVAVLRHGGGLLVQTVDAFPAFTDDPWLVGRVAAVNALNDVYAKGAVPRFALAVVEVPERHGARVLGEALAGVRAELDAAGVSLVGGHTTVGDGLKVGLSITGVPDGDRPLWPTRGARDGDVLLLTRPLGTGVLLHADMAGRATGPQVQALHAHLCTSNRAAVEALAGFDIHAATDVTGFGLARHLQTLLADDAVGGTLRLADLPLLSGVADLLVAGERSTFHEQNRVVGAALDVAPQLRRDPVVEVLFDPQTAGGMLVAVPASVADDALAALRAAGCENSAVVGVVGPSTGGWRVRVEP